MMHKDTEPVGSTKLNKFSMTKWALGINRATLQRGMIFNDSILENLIRIIKKIKNCRNYIIKNAFPTIFRFIFEISLKQTISPFSRH